MERRTLMKSRIALTSLAATLLLGSATAALAENHHTCSTSRVAGDWGYTKTGTLVLPTGAVPFASVGRFSLDDDGALSGTNDGNVGGRVSKDVLKGTVAVGADCTGTATIEVYDTSGNILRTLTMGLVFVDDARGARGIVTSLVLPNGASLPSIITADVRRLTGIPGIPRRNW
jgi:hypothetical protein